MFWKSDKIITTNILEKIEGVLRKGLDRTKAGFTTKILEMIWLGRIWSRRGEKFEKLSRCLPPIFLMRLIGGGFAAGMQRGLARFEPTHQPTLMQAFLCKLLFLRIC